MKSILTGVISAAVLLGAISAVPYVQAAQSGQPVRYPKCASGARYNCVVDGDTLWISSQKVRLARYRPRRSAPRNARRNWHSATRQQTGWSSSSTKAHSNSRRGQTAIRIDTAVSSVFLSGKAKASAIGLSRKAWHGPGQVGASHGAEDPARQSGPPVPRTALVPDAGGGFKSTPCPKQEARQKTQLFNRADATCNEQARSSDNEEYRRNHSTDREGGISGILVARGAGRGQPQEAQHSDPKGEPGSTAPALGAPHRHGRQGSSRGGAQCTPRPFPRRTTAVRVTSKAK